MDEQRIKNNLRPAYLYPVKRNNFRKTEEFLIFHAKEAYSIDQSHTISYYYELLKGRVINNNEKLRQRIKETFQEGVFKNEPIEI